MVKAKTKPNSMHRIGLYIRVSTEEQAQNPEGSIKNQEERLHTTLRLKNMDQAFGEVVGVYIDRARSGKDTNRAELQRLLAAIRKREITLVMVSELSRLTRSVKDFTEIKELMDESGCGFMSLRESFDSTTAAGEMVMLLMANLAQFERRQVSERVAANFQARAERGLYNGGVVPVGYKLIPEKPGYLAIDEEQAKTASEAFKAFLREGTLSAAARWLNENGHWLRKRTEGGGSKPRNGYFTFQNLYKLLKSPAYIGLKRFKAKGEWKEVKAVWEPITDERTFYKVQALLKKNCGAKKAKSPNRYPFLLTGLVFCKACGESMTGKSAHGNGGKIPYYDHSSLHRRFQCTTEKPAPCGPNRVQAAKLEPAIWEEIERLLKNPFLGKRLIQDANAVHTQAQKSSELHQLRGKIHGLKLRIEGLAERLSELPKTVSAAPIYAQMEKLEGEKARAVMRLSQCEAGSDTHDEPVELSEYREFLKSLNQLARDEKATDSRCKIVQALIHRIEITSEGYEVKFHAGKQYVEGGLAEAGPPSSGAEAGKGLLSLNGSNSLTNGGGLGK